ncbi:MAG: Peptidase inactive domain protein [Chthoniobacteraceae bacterium]|nr:Peptidase inactive domain protein [Chthoniobacteraceae bacterium]
MLNLTAARTVEPTDALQCPAASARTWTLPNGLVVIVKEDHSAPVASVQAWVQTGSIHEDRLLGAGLSHILEHMLFKGTESRSTSAFAQTIQDAGGYINAYTSFDRTVYWIDIPSKGVDIALDLLADAVQHSTLPAEEYVKEQEVIRREFAMGDDDPDRVASKHLFAAAYRQHPYRHPVIGHFDIFNTLTRDDVMAYYKERYVPNNMFFVVVGDVDAEAVRAQLEAHFEKSPRRPLPSVFIPTEPAQLGKHEEHIEFGTELTRLHMVWHVPELTHPDVPALDLLASILGSGRSARLYRGLREKLGLVHSIDAWCYAPAHPGLFGVDAMLDPEKRLQTESEIERMIEMLRNEEPSIAELEKAKKSSLSHQFHQLTTMRGRASDLGSNWLLTRNLDFSRTYLEAIQRVTPADVRRVAQTYLVDSNRTITSLNPLGTLAAAVSDLGVSDAGEIQKFELSNGLRLLVREDARLPLVSVVATFKAGLLAETPENNGITRLLAKTLLKGTASRTADQIADEIEAVGGSISSDGGNNSLTLAVRVMQPDLALGIALLGDVLQNATIPEKAIVREKEAQLAGIKAQDEELTTVARHLLNAHLLAGHPYSLRGSGTPDSVNALTREDLVAYKERHLVGRNGVIAVFGNVNALEVKALVERELGQWPAGEPALIQPPQPAPLAKALEVSEIKNKAQAILMVGFQGTDLFSPDRAALELIDEASSDLGSRFFIRIREELGLAYFVGSSHSVGLARGPFVFYLGTDPLKLTAVKAELLDEIRKLAENGLTEQELARAKEKLLGQQDIRNQSNDTFAFTVALDELYGLGFDHYKGMRRRVQAVTLEEVRQVTRRYFIEQPAVISLVHPPAV